MSRLQPRETTAKVDHRGMSFERKSTKRKKFRGDDPPRHGDPPKKTIHVEGRYLTIEEYFQKRALHKHKNYTSIDPKQLKQYQCKNLLSHMNQTYKVQGYTFKVEKYSSEVITKVYLRSTKVYFRSTQVYFRSALFYFQRTKGYFRSKCKNIL